MIKKEEIDLFIEKIPPAPTALRETVRLLNNGELTQAAKIAEEDLALKAYLKNLVNKPIFGFKTEVSDISQIFGILGVSSSQQTVYNYMTNLLSPKEWKLFNLNASTFHLLQANLSKHWEKILTHLEIKNKDICNSITLLPASIIVSEALFCQKIEEINLLRSAKEIDFNTILIRLTNMSLFDICAKIGQKWELPQQAIDIVKASSGLNPSKDEQTNKLGKWMHLLLFYELSQAEMLPTGLNDFVDFQVDYVSDIYNEFATIMDIS